MPVMDSPDVIGPHIGASAALAARFADCIGAGTSTLVWDVDLTINPMAEAEWFDYLTRLRDLLHSLPSGGAPIQIRLHYLVGGLHYLVGGQKVATTIRLPLPEVSAHYPRLTAYPPPVGRWRLEFQDGPVVYLHRGAPDEFGFSLDDLPF